MSELLGVEAATQRCWYILQLHRHRQRFTRHSSSTAVLLKEGRNDKLRQTGTQVSGVTYAVYIYIFSYIPRIEFHTENDSLLVDLTLLAVVCKHNKHGRKGKA